MSSYIRPVGRNVISRSDWCREGQGDSFPGISSVVRSDTIARGPGCNSILDKPHVGIGVRNDANGYLELRFPEQSCTKKLSE